MRILHTADWHLGRIFHGLHLTEEQSYVLDQLVQVAQEEHTQAVLIAGDIYDRAVPPAEAVKLLDEILERLIYEAGQTVILIAGTHDDPQRLSFGRRLLAAQKLYIYGPLDPQAAPVVLQDEYGPVYFAPLTYGEPLAAQEILAWKDGEAKKATLKTHAEVVRRQIELMLAQIPAGVRKVALAHVFLTSALTSDSERPLSIGGTTTVPAELFAAFDYTALGHLHQCQSCGTKIRYGGSLLKYSFNEVHQKKGVHLIDLQADGSFTAQTIPLNPRHELGCLTGSFEDLQHQVPKDDPAQFLQITLTDQAPILDAKARLEKIYPHILQLQYQNNILAPTADPLKTPRRSLEPSALFASFFKETEGRELLPAEQDLLQQALRQAAKEETEK